jgi:ribonuclease HI
MKINIWTDGGCQGNPGPGGWAFTIVDGRGAVIGEGKGAERDTTNNRMEIMAVISAFEFIAAKKLKNDGITVFTDSQYVQKGMTEWLEKWKENGWKTSDRKPVKNADLWMRLDALAGNRRAAWEWVKGHEGIPLNERCDRMTQEAIASLAFPPSPPKTGWVGAKPASKPAEKAAGKTTAKPTDKPVVELLRKGGGRRA